MSDAKQMQISFDLSPEERLTFQLERHAPASFPTLEVLEEEQVDDLPQLASWKDGVLYQIVAGRLVSGPLTPR